MSAAKSLTASAANRGPAADLAAAAQRRDEEDTAAVLAVLAALSDHGSPEPAAPSSVWSDPAHRLGRALPGALSWWASGSRRGRR